MVRSPHPYVPVSTPRQINSLLTGFYGYGNLDGDYWFVGMEEGGGNSVEELDARIQAWHHMPGGQAPVVDLMTYTTAVARLLARSNPTAATNLLKWFRTLPPPNNPPIQSTWGKIIRAILKAGRKPGVNLTTGQIRQFQALNLGTTSGNHCLLELFPIACPNKGIWIHPPRLPHPLLSDRKIYTAGLSAVRVTHLKTLLQCSYRKPKSVVFLSLDLRYLGLWGVISGVQRWNSLSMTFGGSAYRILQGYNPQRQQFLISEHPTRGICNHYFDWLGTLL